MNSKAKSLILNFSSYTIINLFNSLTPFIVLPILTRSLTPADIGLIDIFTTTSILITPIIGLCFIQSISKLFYVYEDRTKYLSTLFTSITITLLVCISICYFTLFTFDIFEIEHSYKTLIFTAFTYVFLNIYIEGFLILKRNEEKIKEYAVVRLFKSFLEIILTIVLINFIDDYQLRIIAIIAATAVTAVYVIYLLIAKSGLYFTLNPVIFKRIFIYSSPLILHTIFANILNYADRYFIINLYDAADLGKYSVAYQLCMIMSLLINSFNMAWTPYFMKNMVNNKIRFEKSYKNYYKIYILALLVFAILLFFLMPIVYEFYIGANYQIDSLVYAFLIMGYFFNGLYRFKVCYLFYYEKTMMVAKLSFIAAIINLILNYIYIPKLGVVGAALATLVSYLSLFIILEYSLSKKKHEESN